MNDTQRRILASIEFIEQHLDDDLSLSDVAKRAAFSMYHFHRIFRAMLGVPVGEYIRRRRLTRAGQRLLETRLRILDVALECQFESQESFTRAFKQLYGVAPGEFRRRKHLVMPCVAPRSPEQLLQLMKGTLMEPRIVKRPAMKMAAISSTFSIESRREIPLLWEKFLAQLPKIQHKISDETFGICEDAPGKNAADGCWFLYSVAVEVSQEDTLPAGFEWKSIPAGDYLVFTHRGPFSALPATVDKMWAEWLPQSKHKRREAPDFELYDHRFKAEAPDSEVELYVPIEAPQ